MSVLILDSEPHHAARVELALRELQRGVEVRRSFAALAEAAVRCSMDGRASLLLVDDRLVPDDRLASVIALIRVAVGVPVVLMVDACSMAFAVRAGRVGVREVLCKPFCRGALEAILFPERASSASLRALSLDELEREHLLLTLARCDGNKSLAARQLCIKRKSLQRKLDRVAGRPAPG